MTLADNAASRVQQLQGPILVLGASGFVGANLFRHLLRHRQDVYGTTSRSSAWRLEGLPEENVRSTDLLVEQNLDHLLDTLKPRTVFDCVAYGAYSFEKDSHLIFRTNVNFVVRLIEKLTQAGVHRYIHAGSSSEYGDVSAGPLEESFLRPNSHYAASKAAAAELIYYYGKKLGLACANLRLYSVYGPYEDASRLIPALVSQGLKGAYPPLVEPKISRDFIYVDDASESFIDTALNLKPEHFGESFNIGSGQKTTMGDVAKLAQEIFQIKLEPAFATMPQREWDVTEWYADPGKAQRLLGWSAKVGLRQGLEKTAEWFRNLKDVEAYQRSSKKYGLDPVYSVSAIVVCSESAAAIPEIYKRLKTVFQSLNIQHEIILVSDDGKPETEELIRSLSARDRDLIGLAHSRDFGPQAAFRSGMESASKNACVLLNADLQDPPELVEQFVEAWKAGSEVVYGRRIKSGEPFYIAAAQRLFYMVFNRFSYISIPHNVGDFCLMDKRVVRSLLQFPERDLFIRGLRAFAGFKQIGVDYARPPRSASLPSAGGFFKSIHWAKRGILSFSNTPLSLLSLSGFALFVLSCLLGLSQLAIRLLSPESTPRGITTTLIVIIFFGSINLLAISILGEYLATIFDEVKNRPHSILRQVIKDGEIRAAAEVALGERSS